MKIFRLKKDRKVFCQKRWGIIASLFFLACSTLDCNAALAEHIKFKTHSVSNQSYFDEAGNLRGKKHAGRRAFNIELVHEMMLLMGHTESIEVMPLKRAILLVQSEANHALFNLNRTEAREKQLKWVGPIQSSITSLYENINAPTGIKNLEDAKKVEAICVLRGNLHHRYFDREGYNNIYPANSYGSCADMLALKRVDLTPLSNLSRLVLNKNSERARNLNNTKVVLSRAEGYIAFSPQTPDKVIDQWQAVLDKIKATGRYDELVELYLKPE
jgi:polar amino acid transport system substrate-binding protein